MADGPGSSGMSAIEAPEDEKSTKYGELPSGRQYRSVSGEFHEEKSSKVGGH